jgi:hypothetical protein
MTTSNLNNLKNNSRTKAAKFLTAAGLALLFAGAATALIVFDHHAKRIPASILTETVDTPFTINIVAVNGIPDRDDQELTLRADVIMNANIQADVDWSWHLPPGASIVAGEENETWPGLKAGERAHAEISLLNVSKESMKTVTFSVKASTKNNVFDGIAAFATKGNPDNLNSSLERTATHR